MSSEDGRLGIDGAAPAQAGVVRSALWRVLEMAGSEGLSFVFFIVMARCLAPDEFGSVALAGSVLQLALGLLQRGLPEALIQAPELDLSQMRDAVTTSAAAGLVLAGVLMLMAWPLGWVLQREAFPALLAALAPLALLQGLAMPLHALLRRRFDFRRIALRTLAATLTGGLVAVSLAQAGAGPWALVAQQWVVLGVGAWILVRSAPGLLACARPQWARVAPLWTMARPIMMGGLLTNASRRLDTVALGLFALDHEVGLYFLVARLVQSMQLLTTHSINEVGLVVLARMQGQPERLAVAIVRAFRFTAWVTALSFGVLILGAPAWVPRLFGADWADAVGALQVLAALSAVSALATVAQQVLVAVGAARDAGRLAAWGAFLQGLAALLGAPFGVLPMVWAIGLAQIVLVWPTLACVAQQTGVTRPQALQAVGVILVAALLALLLAQMAGSILSTPLWSGGVAGAVFALVMGGLGYRWRQRIFGGAA